MSRPSVVQSKLGRAFKKRKFYQHAGWGCRIGGRAGVGLGGGM